MQEGPIQSHSIPDRLERLFAYTDTLNFLSWQKLNPIQLPTLSAQNMTVSAGHLVCHTAHSVLVYRIPSRLRGITERTWYHEFDFPGYKIKKVNIELDEDLLVVACLNTLRRSVVDDADFSHNFN
jgi:hypothetical protein